ncbi:MAG TPA: hypothetical protein VK574_20715 [Terracidiphilus sp.]|nr:hypothetical protein [Terracidiphilus sp.]
MDARTTFAYAANKTLGDPRLIRTIRAFRQSLGFRPSGAAGSLAEAGVGGVATMKAHGDGYRIPCV